MSTNNIRERGNVCFDGFDLQRNIQAKVASFQRFMDNYRRSLLYVLHWRRISSFVFLPCGIKL